MCISRAGRFSLWIGVLLTVAADPLAAGIFTSAESPGSATNNTIATAELILGATFTTPVPATVFDPPGWATATVLASGGGDVDFYQFVTAGGGALFDIDNDPSVFDGILSLFDSSGTLFGFNDDSFPADPGTAFGFDPFLGTITLAPGSYFIAVSQFPNFASARLTASSFTSLLRPDGGIGGF